MLEGKWGHSRYESGRLHGTQTVVCPGFMGKRVVTQGDGDYPENVWIVTRNYERGDFGSTHLRTR